MSKVKKSFVYKYFNEIAQISKKLLIVFSDSAKSIQRQYESISKRNIFVLKLTQSLVTQARLKVKLTLSVVDFIDSSCIWLCNLCCSSLIFSWSTRAFFSLANIRSSSDFSSSSCTNKSVVKVQCSWNCSHNIS